MALPESPNTAIALPHDLTGDERAVLETLSVARQPLAVTIAARAASVIGRAEAILDRLCARVLVRVDDTTARVDPRVAASIIAYTPRAQLATRHLRVALELEAAGAGTPEVLASHYAAAGDSASARRLAREAAERAMRALAFSRAAHWYAVALAFTSAEPRARRRGRVELADALARSGLVEEAAQLYLRSARGVDDDDALEWRRRAAESLLAAGRVDRGLRWYRPAQGCIHRTAHRTKRAPR